LAKINKSDETGLYGVSNAWLSIPEALLGKNNQKNLLRKVCFIVVVG
jgi:hypothetical protein